MWIRKLCVMGRQPIIEIIDECELNNVDQFESYWISQFKSWGFEITNMTSGGDGYSWLERTHTDKSKFKCKLNHPFRKSIVQYDKEGNIIDKYLSSYDAVNATGLDRSHITRCCKQYKHCKTVGSYIFRYDEKFPAISFAKKKRKY